MHQYSVDILHKLVRYFLSKFFLSSLCFVMVERLFLAVPRGCLRFVIVVFPDHTHLLFKQYWVLTENRIPLKPLLGIVRIVAPSIKSHEQAQ